jgi:hypothetical protein
VCRSAPDDHATYETAAPATARRSLTDDSLPRL